ncbi:MAG: ROK family protein [Lachnospiraceae bacterium]|nr:ROK family protein [Lachnospiraceae bacterium]
MKIGALEAGGTKMVCAVYDENAGLIRESSFPTLTPDETMPVLIDFYKTEGIDALGIGCFGPIDLDRDSDHYGFITSTPKIAWRNYDIVGTFKKALGVPIGFDTDVNGSALGEYTFGIGKNVDSLVYITIGTGIGIGVINEGKLLHGGMHPEGGHIMLTKSAKDPFECICPYHKSCFEGLASGPAIEKRWGRKGQELAGNDEVWALEADYIAKAIFNYTAVLSPKMIILGGGVMHQKQLFPLIREAFKKRNNGYIKNRYTEDTDSYIVCQSLDDKQGILGAYVLGRQSLGMA